LIPALSPSEPVSTSQEDLEKTSQTGARSFLHRGGRELSSGRVAGSRGTCPQMLRGGDGQVRPLASHEAPVVT